MAGYAPQVGPRRPPPRNASAFHRLGALVARYHWQVIALWLAALVAAVPLYAKLNTVLVGGGGYQVPTSDSGRGAVILDQEFGRRTVTTALMIFTSDAATFDSATDATFRDAVNRSIDRVVALEGVKQIVSFTSSGNPRLLSNDRKATYAVLSFATDEEKAKSLTPDVRERLTDQPAGVRAYLIGFPSNAYDLVEQSDKDLRKAESISGAISLVLLLLVFGTLLSAGLPLILAIFAVGIASAILYVIALNVETSSFAKSTASMIGLGLGIDFSLLMVNRFREELERGFSPHEAAANTVGTAGRSIVFSALTVMLGLSVLLLYRLSLVRSIAVGMLLVAGLAMLAAVTLLPALMALLGHKLNALRLVRRSSRAAGQAGEGRWHRWSLRVMRSPWAFLLVTLAILLGLAFPARGLNAIGVGSARTLPEASGSRQAFEALRSNFGDGEATPMTILVKSSNQNGAFEPTALQGLYQLVKELETDPRVARVDSLVGLVETGSPGITEAQFKALTRQQIEANPRARAFLPSLVNVNSGSTTHLLSVVSKQDELGADSLDLVRELRNDIIPSIPAFRAPALQNRCTGGDEGDCTGVYVSGNSALTLDYRNELLSQFPQLVGLVLLVTYVVLVLFFHSLILPLKAVLMNVASILASYGVLVLVFQQGVGEKLLGFEHQGRLSVLTPVILFAILFGLSTDYEVFLLSRVRELFAHSHDNERSVAMGLERTAGIITAAGLIMIVVFGSFALGSTLVIKELGIGLAVAVLLDSTIIRVVMVPASMKLMGAANWWMPKFLDWIPQIKESADEPVGVAHGGARAGQASDQAPPRCPVCSSPRRPSARFCTVCGTPLAPAVGPVGPDRSVPIGDETIVDWRAPAAGPAVEVAPPSAGGPAGDGGVRRVPIVLTNGQQQRPAWLVLRDCYVEDDPRRTGVPHLLLEGVDLSGLGDTRPEIQIRNAHVRIRM